VRNRLGITDRAVLVRVEAECAYGWDVLGYRVGPDLRRFSVDHLRGVHRW
jgi:fido (protein-threonine AMPylation protein)